MRQGVSPPNLRTVSRKFSVNRRGAVEAIWQPLYHYQTITGAPAALPSQLTFFQDPVGSNNGGVALTLADTNVESAGQMPAPKEMLVTNIQIAILPELDPSRAGALNDNWNDISKISRIGHLQFFVGSKTYLNEAPIGRFPVQNRLAGVAESGGNLTGQTDYSVQSGKIYEITPVRLISNQNFSVTLNFPGVNPALVNTSIKIGVILGGFQYRLSQ